jgi:hypothetical protein
MVVLQPEDFDLERLISENSGYKDELYKLFTVEYVKGFSGQIDDLSHTKKTRRRQTPVMTLRALPRLVMILGVRWPLTSTGS